MDHRLVLGQREGRAHERKMAERLWEVTELPLLFRVVLLGQQAEIVAGRSCSFEYPASILLAPHHLIDGGQPERAGKEHAFFAGEAIDLCLRLEAQQQPILEKFAFERGDRADDAGVGHRQEAAQGYEEQAGIQSCASVVLSERPAAGVEPLTAHLVEDCRARREPLHKESRTGLALDRPTIANPGTLTDNGSERKRTVLPALFSMHSLLNLAQSSRPGAGSVEAAVPALENAELAGVYYDQRVGGDCYDFLRVSPTRVLFILLDVAGRIDDNREIVSSAQNTFRSMGAELFAREDANEPEAMIELCLQLNRDIIKTAGRVCSSPAFAGCYNESLGTVSYFNAGHTPGLLRDTRQVIELPATGLPLGLFSHATPDASMVALEPGDALVLVSRGIVEARRWRKELGLDQVKDNLLRLQAKTAQQICTAILDQVQEFTGKPPVQNDVTVLALTRNAAIKAASA